MRFMVLSFVVVGRYRDLLFVAGTDALHRLDINRILKNLKAFGTVTRREFDEAERRATGL